MVLSVYEPALQDSREPNALLGISSTTAMSRKWVWSCIFPLTWRPIILSEVRHNTMALVVDGHTQLFVELLIITILVLKYQSGAKGHVILVVIRLFSWSYGAM